MENDEKIVHIQLDTWYDMGDATEFFNEFFNDGKHEDEINYSEVWYDQAIIFCITTTEQYAKEHHLMEHAINNLECDTFGGYYPKYDPEHFGVDYYGEYEGWAPYKEFNAQLIKAIKEKEKKIMENKFIHTIKSCWLCLRFPFLYPRNRFTGRHQVSALRSITSKLHRNSIQSVSVTGELEKEKKNLYHKTLNFLDIKVILVGDEKLIISNKTDTKEQDLKHIKWQDDRFEILGIDLVFSFLGTPIVKVLVQPKDKNDKTNYGFGYKTVELITNKRKNFWYRVIKWVDSEILDRILFIPTWNELDAMPTGWRKAFGIQMCKDIKTQLKKDHYLYKYRILQIKEKWGELCWYDAGGSRKLHDITQKYEALSYETCIECGKPATKMTGGWICPYCDEHFPEHERIYQEMRDGHWVPVNEDATDYQTIVEMEAENLRKDPSKIKEVLWDAINDITNETHEPKEELYENMHIKIESNSILIDEAEYSSNTVKGLRQPIDEKLYEKYGKKYLILLNSKSPIAIDGRTKVFWSEHFHTYVSAEW